MITPIIYELTVDIKNDCNYFVVRTPQGDNRTRCIDITVVNNGMPYDLPTTGVKYVISGTNAGGGTIYNTCSVVNDKIRVVLSGGMTSYSGTGQYQVVIYSTVEENTVLSCFNLNISVEEGATNVHSIVTSNEYTELANLISQANNFNKWIVGDGVPSNDIGKNMDLYLDSMGGKVYQKTETGWVYQCTLGSNLYVAYANSSTGDGFTTTYTNQSYIGICASQSTTQPNEASSYTWIMISGGDNMKASNYQGSDSNTVAQADKIKGTTRLEKTITTTDGVTSVTFTDSAIKTNSIIEGIYTTQFGLSPLSVDVADGTLTLTFPAVGNNKRCMVEIYNPQD